MNKLNVVFIIILFSLASVSAAGICQYASSASATSENSGSIATYATGAPNAPYVGNCGTWSGYGYTWSPTNWDVRANLTLKYSQPVKASNFTIFGDYDICWNKMWLKNSTTGQQIKVFDGIDNNCTSLKKLDGTFSADIIILETCGWSWSSTDAVQLCGDFAASAPVCGNNKTETGEECDDGNLINGDGCSSICKLETAVVCGNNKTELGEECDDGNLIDDDGCSSECKTENVEVYFVPYVGDFDGSIGSGWYYFYEKMRKWHDDNNMKVGFSYYPSTMNNPDFNQVIGNIYTTPETELILKTEPEFDGTLLDLMTYDEVKTVIGNLQNKFVNGLENLGYTDVQNQVTYNQNQARFTETIRDAVHDLGFKIYLEQYVSEYGYIPMLPNFDITQYSVSLTVSGHSGPDEVFKQPEEVIQELIDFDHPETIYIDGIKVVPFLSHQQDFRISETSDVLNQTKWDIYTTVLLNARKDPRIHILLPEEVYKLRHPNVTLSVCGNNKTETGEECDDGNLINGDGCSSNCTIEGAYSVKLCNWKNCTAGAASVSVDDSYTSCRDKLNANGFKGTYFLQNTKSFTSSKWSLWRTIYNEGHELGAHTQTHPCSAVSESTLRYELSSNKQDILTNIGMPQQELVSFAWPCGYTNTQEKQIADDYFLASRGYFKNLLEDVNPSDFMELKSFNTPHYHEPRDEPPNYLDIADLAESQGKWVNYVFHNSCSDDGAINYLKTKSLWVAPIGDVVKYIKERQSSAVLNLQLTESSMKFTLKDSLNHTLYNEKLTLESFIANKNATVVKVNGINTNFYTYNKNGNYVKFDVSPSGNDNVEIIFLQSQNCKDIDKDGYYAIAGDCAAGNDCNDTNVNINPGKTDICDGKDNNCNIQIDEDFVQKTTTCGIGACNSTGLLRCIAGKEVDSCAPKSPISTNDSTCDEIDDNCNGLVDEDCVKTYLCQYASSASATSENLKGSLAIYATGAPNAPIANCSKRTDWSGYGYSWSPSNWNIKANLTLKYSASILANNFTIFGDYDMCWSRMWLKNSNTGQQIKVFDGSDKNCISVRSVNATFSADTVILETCGNSWSSTDAVRLCGNLI
ncbi:MAG: MopE-related protein [Nanoarchaeota archaeon]|nr:MopE-related protein [Nanoarchaeota archaeon]